MADSVVFHDLSGPDRELTQAEDHWLAALVAETRPEDFVLRFAPSVIGFEPGPILERTLTGGWRAGRYVGELRRGERTLEIRPRLDAATIAAWASAILNVRVVPRSAEHHGHAPALIAELVAAAWRSSLVIAARHGLPGLRAPREHVGAVVKGRISVPDTVRMRAAGRPAVVSVSRPKQIDNPVSRVIVLADRILDRRIGRADWRGSRVEEIMPRFRAATGPRPPTPTAKDFAEVRYTPITLPYRRTAELSWQIIRSRGLRTTATGESAEGVLVDIAELWELFLVHCARRAFGSGAVIHGTRRRDADPLLHSIAVPGAVLGRLYPDIMVDWGRRRRLIIDAKYKPLADPRGVDPADLYQLNAYLTAGDSEAEALGLLGYTRFPDQVAIAAAEARGPWRSATGHELRFERLSVSETECVLELSRIAGSELAE